MPRPPRGPSVQEIISKVCRRPEREQDLDIRFGGTVYEVNEEEEANRIDASLCVMGILRSIEH